jgi:hypothetical protein
MLAPCSLHRAPPPPWRSRFARPLLERLEERDTPSTVTIAVTYGTGRNVTLFGDVSGAPCNAGQMVMISGPATGQAPTDSNGHYSITLQAAGLGTVTARTGDNSASASVTLTDVAPVISDFEAIEGPDHIWTLKGDVSYSRPFDALTVFFNGQPVSITGKVTYTDGTGHFEMQITLNGTISDNGTVYAKAMDAWGTYSDPVAEIIQQTGATGGGFGTGGGGSY